MEGENEGEVDGEAVGYVKISTITPFPPGD